MAYMKGVHSQHCTWHTVAACARVAARTQFTPSASDSPHVFSNPTVPCGFGNQPKFAHVSTDGHWRNTSVGVCVGEGVAVVKVHTITSMKANRLNAVWRDRYDCDVRPQHRGLPHLLDTVGPSFWSNVLERWKVCLLCDEANHRCEHWHWYFCSICCAEDTAGNLPEQSSCTGFAEEEHAGYHWRVSHGGARHMVQSIGPPCKDIKWTIRVWGRMLFRMHCGSVWCPQTRISFSIKKRTVCGLFCVYENLGGCI